MIERGAERDESVVDIDWALHCSALSKNLLLCFTINVAGCSAFQFGLGRVESQGRVARRVAPPREQSSVVIGRLEEADGSRAVDRLCNGVD